VIIGVVACRPPAGDPPAATATAPRASAPSPSASLAIAPGKAPAIAIVNLGPGRFRVKTTAPEATSVKTQATIEQQQPDGTFKPVTLDLANGYRVVTRCPDAAATVAACTSVAASGIELVAWSGMSCGGQCAQACFANVFMRGTFRLVVAACGDDSARVVGPTFEMPPDPAAIERIAASTTVTKITAMAVSLTPKWEGTDQTPGAFAGGLKVTAGSQRTLDAATQQAFVETLRAPKGYDDQVARRCLMGKLVGFRVERTLASSSGTAETATVDIAMDFTCHKIFFVRDGEGRGVHVAAATHFDPLRSPFLAIAKKALPDDAELRKITDAPPNP